MPLSTRTYHNDVVLPYLWGLLPEDPFVRRRIAAANGVSPNNPFALLSIIGLDCPGAVQFCLPESDKTREEQLVPVSDAEIAQRLSLGRNNASGWIAENEHWSLGGQQNKFALRKRGGAWFSCGGGAATTHIFKSGVRGLAHQALNEYICMRLAAECGIDTAKVEYHEFEGRHGIEPAIVIERYDRLIIGESVSRLHQEDLCQALGCLPDNKYAADGGPGCQDALRLLMSTGPTAQSNVASFLQMLFFNHLLAATDAHAKNYSLMLRADGAHHLAPLYDIASIAPYIEHAQWKMKPPKLAMSIGGENRVGRLYRSHLLKMQEQCGLEEAGITVEGCVKLISLYADIIPEKLANIFEELENTQASSASKELRDRMERPIVQLCARTKAHLEG
ncbi:MAG: type II toxin-antitoxin system HipA family toxin [Slackia sp.]|nr:type II toxin-antitoxin system HipA family toxin [Slackia sp.]